jgi:hypothetical protein
MQLPLSVYMDVFIAKFTRHKVGSSLYIYIYIYIYILIHTHYKNIHFDMPFVRHEVEAFILYGYAQDYVLALETTPAIHARNRRKVFAIYTRV